MNIALQMKREDFPKNFCATLAHLLSWRDKRPYDVEWNGAGRKGSGVLYLHSRLGIATPKWADPRRFAFVWRELRSGRSLAESIARRAYLAAHLVPGPTRPLLAEHRVVITPKPLPFDEGFYVPGTNQLRWFDVARSRCIVAAKVGFPDRGLVNQLAVRREHETPAPRLIDVDDDNAIFVEEIASGRANAAIEGAAKQALWERTRSALEPLYNATAIATTIGEHATAIEREIEEHCQRLEVALAQRARTAAASLRDLTSARADAALTTVIAHGDMSAGHVLTCGEEIVIVDWELCGRRHDGYDRACFWRRPQLPDRFFETIGTDCVAADEAVLVLEGLLHHVSDADNSALTGQSLGLQAYLDHLERRRRRSPTRSPAQSPL